jgi:hypothetical protein
MATSLPLWTWDDEHNRYFLKLDERVWQQFEQQLALDQDLNDYYVCQESQLWVCQNGRYKPAGEQTAVPATNISAWYVFTSVGMTTDANTDNFNSGDRWNIASLTEALDDEEQDGRDSDVEQSDSGDEDEEDEEREKWREMAISLVFSIYRYSCGPSTHPLLHHQHIRLLRFSKQSACDTAAPISCELGCFNLSSPPRYTALSYTWGTKSPKTTITLQGNSFEVGPNLAQFLLNQCRGPEASEYLWIDAICIDQSNAAEMNHQVPLMSQIYSRATRVIIWLGEGDEDCSAALHQTALAATSYEAEPLIKLIKHPYWSRLWVVQEIMFASNIVVRCGSTQVDWEDFTRLIELSESYLENGLSFFPPGSSTSMADVANSKASKIVRQKVLFSRNALNETVSLYSLMREFHDSKAERFHDKVFALSGLVTTATGTTINVDYNLSKFELAYRVLTLSGIPKNRPEAITFLRKVFKLSNTEVAQLRKTPITSLLAPL